MLPLKMPSCCGKRQTNEVLRFTVCFPKYLYNFFSVFICSCEIRAPFRCQDVKIFGYSCGDNVLKHSIYAGFGGSKPPPYMVYSTIFYRFNDRWYASRVSSIRKGRGQFVLATRSLLICHLCSQSLPANGIFPCDSRSSAAGASCALCAGSKPGFVHAGTVSAYRPRRCARIPANQPGNLTAAQAIRVIFPYTTALFYAKMMAVHTLPLLAAQLCGYSILPPGGCMNFFSLKCCS